MQRKLLETKLHNDRKINPLSRHKGPKCLSTKQDLPNTSRKANRAARRNRQIHNYS